MGNYEDIIISCRASVREAMQVINIGPVKLALVVDDSRKLVGTVSDGDIRRGLLRGINIEDSVEPLVTKSPVVCKSTTPAHEVFEIAMSRGVYQLPILDEESRVVGLKDFTFQAQNVNKTNKVVIMAGGLGRRLGDLTKETPKPMLDVGSKPILETIIESFVKCGYVNFVLCVNYLSGVIQDYFGDGSRWGANIVYVHERKRMGTAGALSLARDMLDEPFFVMNGDVLTSVNFNCLHDYHLSENATATMAVREHHLQVPYGVVEVNKGRITSIDEKPIHRFYVSAGIYMLSPDVLEYVPDEDYFDMPTLFGELIANGAATVSFPVHEYWIDIGREGDYEKAKKEYNNI